MQTMQALQVKQLQSQQPSQQQQVGQQQQQGQGLQQGQPVMMQNAQQQNVQQMMSAPTSVSFRAWKVMFGFCFFDR